MIRTDVVEKDIHSQIDIANERINNGETDGFRSYEDGIKDALNWILGVSSIPLEEDEGE